VRTLNLERRAVVTFFTTDGSATSGAPSDYVGVISFSVVFDFLVVSQTVSVTINNDQILENLEFFYGNLSTTDGAIEFSASGARVDIVEDTAEDGEFKSI